MHLRPSTPLYEGMEEKTIFLTDHVALNYFLNKYKPEKISKACPHCLAADETTNQYIVLIIGTDNYTSIK